MLKFVYLFSLINIASIYGSIAAIQGILLNRMKLAFAGATIFLGLSAYFFAAFSNAGNVALVVIIALASIWLIVWFQDKLPGDYYLIASIAVLEVLNAIFGSSFAGLGGREGMTVRRFGDFSSAEFEAAALIPTAGIALVCLVIYRFLFSTNLGVFIDKIGAIGAHAQRWIPARKIKRLVTLFCISIFFLIGFIYLHYTGGVSPAIFSLDLAFLLIIFSILSLRSGFLGLLFCLLYFLLPWVLEKLTVIGSAGPAAISGPLSNLDVDFIAEIVRLVWGLVVVIVAKNLSLDNNTRKS